MNTRDTARLLKIDSEMLELEEKINDTLRTESEMERTTFLRSRVYKYQYDKLKRQRANLQRSVSAKLTRRQTYSMILEERKRAVVEVEKEIADVKRNIVQIGANFMAYPTENAAEELKIQNKYLNTLKLKFYNKERAVMNWLAKSEQELPERRSTASNLIVKELKKNRTPEEILGHLPNWNLSSKAVENNAGELLMPKQRVVIDFDE